jgi:hypothetical protein
MAFDTNPQQPFQLNPDRYEIFTEVAILRDYWDDLGDSDAYTDATHDGRRTIVDSFVRGAGLQTTIDKHELFWTTSKKLVSPGKWDEGKIDATTWSADEKKKMKRYKQSFNAKPDLLIVSGHFATMIEVKIESRFSEDQKEIQASIRTLLNQYVPAFRNVALVNNELTTRDASGGKIERSELSWRIVVDMLDGLDDVDDFSRKSLMQLKRYYSM